MLGSLPQAIFKLEFNTNHFIFWKIHENRCYLNKYFSYNWISKLAKYNSNHWRAPLFCVSILFSRILNCIIYLQEKKNSTEVWTQSNKLHQTSRYKMWLAKQNLRCRYYICYIIKILIGLRLNISMYMNVCYVFLYMLVEE